MTDDKLFYFQGWGECSYASLWAFVPFYGKKSIKDLEVNETTEGLFQNPTSDKKPERVTRIR